MNFLAHCALANDTASTIHALAKERSGLIAGGVIGDFVKGPVPDSWPLELQTGVRLHRKIDALSNQDPAIRELSATFAAPLRRFAPIFLDLIADHALACDWHDHYPHDARQFSQLCYSAIASYRAYLPPHGLRFFSYMQQEDLLGEYGQWRHVRRGTTSVLRRLDREELAADADLAMQASITPTRKALEGIMQRLRAGTIDWLDQP